MRGEATEEDARGAAGHPAVLEAGQREVVVVDRVPGRLPLAERFGATAVDLERGDPLSTVRDRSEGRVADAAIEAVGTPHATRLAADLLRRGGRIAAVGVYTEPHLAISPFGAPQRPALASPPSPASGSSS